MSMVVQVQRPKTYVKNKSREATSSTSLHSLDIVDTPKLWNLSLESTPGIWLTQTGFETFCCHT